MATFMLQVQSNTIDYDRKASAIKQLELWLRDLSAVEGAMTNQCLRCSKGVDKTYAALGVPADAVTVEIAGTICKACTPLGKTYAKCLSSTWSS